MAGLDLGVDEAAHDLEILFGGVRRANQELAELLVVQALRPGVVLQVVDEERVGVGDRDLAVVACLAADSSEHGTGPFLRGRRSGEQREGEEQHGATSYSSGSRAGNTQREPEEAA